MKLSALLMTTTLAFSLAACNDADASGTMSKKDVETIVYEYIMENPEIIRDAMIALEAKQDQLILDETRALVAANKAVIYNDKRDFSLGPDNAKVTIIEFFDYNCGYCKNSTKWLQDMMEKHPKDVRVVFKELPLLDSRTKTSRNAAKAALAAGKQGKYADMHFALMEARGLTWERVKTLADEAGVDTRKLEADMEDAALDKHINDNMAIAEQIPLFGGTPFFIIGDEFISGANTQKLNSALEKALGS